MSALREASEEYLALRRAMGFKLHRHDRMLAELVADLESARQPAITTRAVLEWATKQAGHPQEWAARLSVARGFARYLRALDGISEVPPTDLLPSCRRRLAPYLYSEQEIAAVMAATAGIYFPQRAATYRTLIGLLAVTGMRIGEAIALDCDDVDLTRGGA
jgi:integrase/recombinase XerD